MPCTVIVLILVELEGIALLLYCVISEMHKQVIYVLRVLTRWFILFCGKTRQPLLKYEDSQWINPIY